MIPRLSNLFGLLNPLHRSKGVESGYRSPPPPYSSRPIVPKVDADGFTPEERAERQAEFLLAIETRMMQTPNLGMDDDEDDIPLGELFAMKERHKLAVLLDWVSIQRIISSLDAYEEHDTLARCRGEYLMPDEERTQAICQAWADDIALQQRILAQSRKQDRLPNRPAGPVYVPQFNSRRERLMDARDLARRLERALQQEASH
ncbi:hypothetical protein BCR37DRAFT_388808 [Protomyces lactucae-debilis]|uniref:Uncharacterized protein n=1 Tax=Protomyces lactucae-debilis TaxID=2754530 RepID=A0A1Y2F442_PROLT|nr:uncharacterized protein BCR37DRAFT_388808 [Protomyces lactucae-debilis]ORY78632.1 hypothetical protein BCR37DRAFT_388808 [Protomyces lactucae-debilis]